MFALPLLMVMIIFLVGMNLLNPDSFIVRRNTQRFSETGKLDGRYLASLSADSVPAAYGELYPLLRDNRPGSAESMMACLAGVPGNDELRKWQEFNYARMLAARFRQRYPVRPANCPQLLSSDENTN